MKEGLSVGLVVGMSGGGEGMLGGRLGRLNVTRTPSGMVWTSWLAAGWRTGGSRQGEGQSISHYQNNIQELKKTISVKNPARIQRTPPVSEGLETGNNLQLDARTGSKMLIWAVREFLQRAACTSPRRQLIQGRMRKQAAL